MWKFLLVCIWLLMFLGLPAYGEVLDKMNGCHTGDPWFELCLGLFFFILLWRSNLLLIMLGQLYTGAYFAVYFAHFLGIHVGMGDPVWISFQEEINQCSQYSVIGFWGQYFFAFAVWVLAAWLIFRLRANTKTN